MEFFVERYKNTERLSFDCEVITPMFLSGSDQNTAELRTSSIKGALRFWWRAIVGQRYKNLDMLKDEEGCLFGTTEIKSKIAINLDSCGKLNFSKENFSNGEKYDVISSKGNFRGLNILDYLAFGIAEYNKDRHQIIYNRPYLKAGVQFKLNLDCHNIDSVQRSDLLNSISCLHYYGALGSKARNGFGCISVTPFETIKFKRYDSFAGELLQYTAFSKEAMYFESTQTYDNWEKALSELGGIYRNSRLSLENKHSFSRRALLAKPLIVKSEKINILDRHSKPYFLHVSKQNGKYKGSILFLPYHYYDDKKFVDYINACNHMNKIIQEGDSKNPTKLRKVN